MERLAACRRSAFTLVELLVVVTIIGVLLALAVPAFNSIIMSTRLSTAASQMGSQLNLARQLALTRNRVSELRLYVGPSSFDQTEVVLGIQCFVDGNSDGNFAPAEATGRVEWFPEGIVLAADVARSSALETAATATTAVPGRGQMTYKALRFRPDGSPMPAQQAATAGAWGLTIMAGRDLSLTANNELPANFVMLGINPVTGRFRSFQP